MTNEEFQKLVLGKLEGIENDVGQLKNDIGQLKNDTSQLKTGQERMEKDIQAIVEQTADLTEFRQECNEKLDALLEDNKSIHGIIGEHEVAIRTLRRRVV